MLTIVQYCQSLPTNDSVVLKPIHIAQYDRSFRLQSRDTDQYSKLDLTGKGQLIYGGAQGMWALKFEEDEQTVSANVFQKMEASFSQT